jgi:hypothetical protein
METYCLMPNKIYAKLILALALFHLAANSQANEPPVCADVAVLNDLRSAHTQLEGAFGFSSINKISVQETAVVDYIARLDTPRNRGHANEYPFGKSRFCSAHLQLTDKTEEDAYYRIDALKNTSEGPYMFNPYFSSLVKYYGYSLNEDCSSFMKP